MNRGWRHCNSCHHEFAGTDDTKCDWCGGSSYLLQAYPPLFPKLQKMVQEFVEKRAQYKLLN